jgi:hypothetical protein
MFADRIVDNRLARKRAQAHIPNVSIWRHLALLWVVVTSLVASAEPQAAPLLPEGSNYVADGPGETERLYTDLDSEPAVEDPEAPQILLGTVDSTAILLPPRTRILPEPTQQAHFGTAAYDSETGLERQRGPPLLHLS